MFSVIFIFFCLYTGTGTGTWTPEGTSETACQLGGSYKNKDWNDSKCPPKMQFRWWSDQSVKNTD